jgi:UDP-N-acetyl-D-galactosamine dehydrogenase
MRDDIRIAVLGLGYVGLPLAAAFGEHWPTVGFDIDARRIAELREGHDRTLELDREELTGSKQLTFSGDPTDLNSCNVFVIAVPTPIDEHKYPDMRALRSASAMVARALSKGDVVIYESTVYPGATEEVCVPVLESGSGLRFNEDFGVGYSPERANPGDREHRLANITKVTSGSTPETAAFVDMLYNRVVAAGTYLAPSIQVAEAAKVIENTQRDLNIALVNELALIFNRLGIDTEEVLKAAGTKWNFLPFRPGLVGGHCIGVDPYYLTHKAQAVGYHPEVILAGRRINDGMGPYVGSQVVKGLIGEGCAVSGSRVLMMGLTFKENCPDLRNTRVIDIVRELAGYGIQVDVWDPWVDQEQAHEEFGLDLLPAPAAGGYDAIVLAVAHSQFRELGLEEIRKFGSERCVIYDVKSVLGVGERVKRL